MGIGCKKNKEDKLAGEWKMVALAENEYDSLVHYDNSWTFEKDNRLIRLTNDGKIDTGFYFLGQEFGEIFLSIQGLPIRATTRNGNFTIKKLNSKILIIEQPEPYLLKEFYRK